MTERPVAAGTARAAALAVAIIAALVLPLLATQGWLGPRASAAINTSALLHDGRNLLYRTPRGVVPAGQAITLRLRTAANNVGKVLLRTWDTAAAGGHGDVIWYTARRTLTRGAYDYWEVVIPPRSRPRTFWYKWLIAAASGTQQVWYEDHYDRVHGTCDQVGGPGQVFTYDLDCSYEFNIYQAGFDVPDRVKHAVIYQIFVDRFFNGSTANDALVQPNRYDGWGGFDSLPQLTEQQDVRDFIFAGDPNFVWDANDAVIRQRYGERPLVASGGANSVATYWLAQGADGWRLDVAEGKSDDWWRAFRTAIKAMDPEAISIGEHWGDASEWLLGDQQDGTMNYRFRSAVLDFFDNGGIDPDTGHDNGIAYTASQFDAHLQAVLDEYPLPAVYASMNLLDSHDTGRILWELGDSPGATPDQIALAKQKLRLIVLFQMTWIGAPTIYYGDEAGQTQTTYENSKVDPGDRRTFPWDHQDTSLEDWYREWIGVRAANPVLATGAETTLLTDDAHRVFAFQRRDETNLAVVVLNADALANTHTVTLTLANVPDGTQFVDANTDIVQDHLVVSQGKLVVPVNGESGRVLVPLPGQPLAADGGALARTSARAAGPLATAMASHVTGRSGGVIAAEQDTTLLSSLKMADQRAIGGVAGRFPLATD